MQHELSRLLPPSSSSVEDRWPSQRDIYAAEPREWKFSGSPLLYFVLCGLCLLPFLIPVSMSPLWGLPSLCALVILVVLGVCGCIRPQQGLTRVGDTAAGTVGACLIALGLLCTTVQGIIMRYVDHTADLVLYSPHCRVKGSGITRDPFYCAAHASLLTVVLFALLCFAFIAFPSETHT
jgi:hypothetical protein